MTNGHVHHDGGDGGADVVMDEAFWDERYRSRDALWSGQPNPQLVREAAAMVPGTALDAGSGEGADAVWLAARGWDVVAADVSTVALERGAARALELGTDVARRIRWEHTDLTQWTPPASTYDLVTIQFLHLPTDHRKALYRRLADAVAPGGALLIVGHHPSDRETTVPRPAAPDLFFTASDVAATLDPREWVVLVDEARPRDTVDPEGHTVTIHDAVLLARRTA